MLTIPVSTSLSSNFRPRIRSAVVASADHSFRQRLAQILAGLRWQVREVAGGAEAWREAEDTPPEAMIVDSWLPDLDLNEFLQDFRGRFPQVDVIAAGGGSGQESPRSPYRQELLYALRRCQDDTAAWNNAPVSSQELASRGSASRDLVRPTSQTFPRTNGPRQAATGTSPQVPATSFAPAMNMNSALASPARGAAACAPSDNPDASERLPELIGNAPCMLEISRRIRLVAPRITPVLIEGPTGSGKEVVAQALHRLSARSRKPFIAINCAAIPEALLEAELFGHTRGAFTGAVQGRVGRIEAADGGTLFLDEIGEMPLALQAKLLRFVERGELQRVGDNETVKVDVRIIAATHRPLAQHAADGSFRSDLYYRLAVFLIHTPALREHNQDVPLLISHFLEQMGRETPIKRVDEGALTKLAAYTWPGNVRELEHVLERAVILAGDAPVLTAREIDFGVVVN